MRISLELSTRRFLGALLLCCGTFLSLLVFFSVREAQRAKAAGRLTAEAGGLSTLLFHHGIVFWMLGSFCLAFLSFSRE